MCISKLNFCLLSLCYVHQVALPIKVTGKVIYIYSHRLLLTYTYYINEGTLNGDIRPQKNCYTVGYKIYHPKHCEDFEMKYCAFVWLKGLQNSWMSKFGDLKKIDFESIVKSKSKLNLNVRFFSDL